MTHDAAEVEARLLRLIDDVLTDKIAFEKFAKQFEKVLIDELPEGALPDRAYFFDDELDYLDSVDWTAGVDDEPSREAAATGFISQRSYLELLRKRREGYRSQFGR
jgi:hypothetical protein